MVAFGVPIGFPAGAAIGLTDGGTAGLAACGAVSSATGDRVARGLAPGAGLIGRTGSNNWDRSRRGDAAGVADCCGAAVALVVGDNVGLGVSVAWIDAVALGDGEAVALGDGDRDALCEGEGEGLGLFFALGKREGEGVGFSFFFAVDFLRGLAGVGVGCTKTFFSLSRSDSFFSWVARPWLATAITPIIAIAINERSFIFIRCFL